MEWIIAFLVFGSGYGIGIHSVDPEVQVKEIVIKEESEKVQMIDGLRVMNLSKPIDLAEGCNEPILVSDLSSSSENRRKVMFVKVGCES